MKEAWTPEVILAIDLKLSKNTKSLRGGGGGGGGTASEGQVHMCVSRLWVESLISSPFYRLKGMLSLKISSIIFFIYEV